MKKLVELLKRQALEKDAELNRKDREIDQIKQGFEIKQRAARQERSQMKEAILSM